MRFLACLGVLGILAGIAMLRFLPFLVVAFIIVHFLNKWW